jgi:hypothetical protein
VFSYSSGGHQRLRNTIFPEKHTIGEDVRLAVGLNHTSMKLILRQVHQVLEQEPQLGVKSKLPESQYYQKDQSASSSRVGEYG